jgi:hypothetical protein
MAHRSRKIVKQRSAANAPTLGQSVRGDRALVEHRRVALALVEELLDAHLDTIEMMSKQRLNSETELSHVRYLQALYRHGRATTAALADGSAQS